MLSGLIFIGCVVWCCNRTMSPVRLLALLAGFVMAGECVQTRQPLSTCRKKSRVADVNPCRDRAGAFVQPVPSVGRAAASLAPRQQQHRRVASLPVPELPTTTICWAADKNQVRRSHGCCLSLHVLLYLVEAEGGAAPPCCCDGGRCRRKSE